MNIIPPLHDRRRAAGRPCRSAAHLGHAGLGERQLRLPDRHHAGGGSVGLHEAAVRQLRGLPARPARSPPAQLRSALGQRLPLGQHGPLLPLPGVVPTRRRSRGAVEQLRAVRLVRLRILSAQRHAHGRWVRPRRRRQPRVQRRLGPDRAVQHERAADLVDDARAGTALPLCRGALTGTTYWVRRHSRRRGAPASRWWTPTSTVGCRPRW